MQILRHSGLYQTFVTALVLNAAIAAAELMAFVILRHFFPKIYSSRSELIPKARTELRADPLPSHGVFRLFRAIIRADERVIIT